MVWSTDNYHDYRNPGFGGVDMSKFNKVVFDSLKPGGVYIIEDYQAAPGAGATGTGTLHRIESATVQKEVEAAGKAQYANGIHSAVERLAAYLQRVRVRNPQ